MPSLRPPLIVATLVLLAGFAGASTVFASPGPGVGGPMAEPIETPDGGTALAGGMLLSRSW